MKKYLNRPLFTLAVLASLLAGLEMPFNTFTYSFFFYLIEKRLASWIVPAIVLILMGYALFAGLKYWQTRIVNRNIFQINLALKTQVVQHRMAISSSIGDHETDNVSFFMNDLKLLEDNYWRQIFSLLGAGTMVIGTLGYALYSNVLVTLVFLAFMVVPTFAPKLFSRSIQVRTQQWSQQNQTLSATVHDLFHGALLLKRYTVLHGFDSRLKSSLSGMEGANARLKNQLALSNAVIGFLFMVFSDILIGLGIYLTITGRLQLSQFVAIQYSSSWILNGFNQIVAGWNTITSTKAIRQQVAQDTTTPALPQASTAAAVRTVELQHVTFAYQDHPIFQDLSLQVHQGDKVLIRGRSGIGKSTLIRLLLQEETPTAGCALVNGQAYTQADADQWFGVVGQTPVVFQDTVQQNITLGQPASVQSLQSALAMAGLPELATTASLNASISEEGTNFSGGQLKRLEIARALFFNRKVLLIDEGTASLDPATALAIHRQILANPQLTVIEVDHHIPADILPLYTAVYDLQAGQLTPATAN